MCRWYSKTFSTPLHEVCEKISEYDLLQAFFEERAILLVDSSESEDELALRQQIDELSKSEAESLKDQLEKDRVALDDKRLLEEMERHNKATKESTKEKKRKEIERKVKRDREFAKALKSIDNADITSAPLKEELIRSEKLDAEFDMSFVGLEDPAD